MKKGFIIVCSLVLALGLTVGFSFSFTPVQVAQSADTMPADIQEIEVQVGGFAYPAITLQVDKAARINFVVSAEDLNGCNDEIIIPEWNIRQRLQAGDNFVEITPTKAGTFAYACWMNMIRSSITVVDENMPQTVYTGSDSSKYCCGCYTN